MSCTFTAGDRLCCREHSKKIRRLDVKEERLWCSWNIGQAQEKNQTLEDRLPKMEEENQNLVMDSQKGRSVFVKT